MRENRIRDLQLKYKNAFSNRRRNSVYPFLSPLPSHYFSLLVCLSVLAYLFCFVFWGVVFLCGLFFFFLLFLLYLPVLFFPLDILSLIFYFFSPPPSSVIFSTTSSLRWGAADAEITVHLQTKNPELSSVYVARRQLLHFAYCYAFIFCFPGSFDFISPNYYPTKLTRHKQ